MDRPYVLNEGEIHLWMTHPEQIQDPDLLARYQSLLTPEELASQQRYYFAKDRHSALVTRAFVRDLLSHYAPVQPQDWRFVIGEKNKPEISHPPIPLRFNLSHTNGLIICAVTLNNDIGCDVEYTVRKNDVLAVANRFFSSSEIEELFDLPPSKQRSRFFDYWTLKESYIKAWGLGLAIPLKDFSFKIGPGNSGDFCNSNIRLSVAPCRNDTPECWHSWLLYPSADHRIAISIRSYPHAQHVLRIFESVPLSSVQSSF